MNYYDELDEYGRLIILVALTKNKWNQTKAAKALGIHRNTIIKKMKKYNLYKDAAPLLTNEDYKKVKGVLRKI